jgi:hypothetical protein
MRTRLLFLVATCALATAPPASAQERHISIGQSEKLAVAWMVDQSGTTAPRARCVRHKPNSVHCSAFGPVADVGAFADETVPGTVVAHVIVRRTKVGFTLARGLDIWRYDTKMHLKKVDEYVGEPYTGPYEGDLDPTK